MKRTDGESLIFWEQRIDGFMMHDPAISIEKAREAATNRENFYRKRIADGKIDPDSFLESEASKFRSRQLQELGLDLETLEVRQVQG